MVVFCYTSELSGSATCDGGEQFGTIAFGVAPKCSKDIQDQDVCFDQNLTALLEFVDVLANYIFRDLVYSINF